LRDNGKPDPTSLGSRKVLHSWLSYNGINVRLKVNIAGEHETPIIAEKRVPSKEELEKITRNAGPRARVSIALMAFQDRGLEAWATTLILME
jgi:hypothetical protein